MCAFGRGADCPTLNLGADADESGSVDGHGMLTTSAADDDGARFGTVPSAPRLAEHDTRAAADTWGKPHTGSSRLAVGARDVLVTDRDGFVWTWGLDRSLPTPVCLPGGVGDCVPLQVGAHGLVSAGGHALAVDAFGNVYQWRQNSAPELVCAEGTDRLHQEACRTFNIGSHGVVDAGMDHSLAVDGEGFVWAWGRNDYGQLGNGTTASSDVPVPVCADVGAESCEHLNVGQGGRITAGTVHSLAADAGGNVWAWGYNAGGQLGDGMTAQRHRAHQVCMLGETGQCTPFNVGSAGAISAGSYSLALDATGTVWSWGHRDAGSGSPRLWPQVVCSAASEDTCSPFVLGSGSSISAGWGFDVAVDEVGDVWVWGDASWLYQGEAHDPRFPSRVCVGDARQDCATLNVGADGAIGAGGGFAVAIAESGQTFSWGSYAGGTSAHAQERVHAAPVCATTDCVPLDLGDLARPREATSVLATAQRDWSPHVAAGIEHSLLLDASRRAWAWGRNDGGQVDARLSLDGVGQPQLITLPGPATSLGGGGHHSFALLEDGTVWVWGLNERGQAGIGTYLQTPRSVHGAAVADVASAQSVVSGANHLMALLDDGMVMAWGGNDHGQLGDGSTVGRPKAAAVAGIDDIIQITAGRHHSLALRGNGTVWAWGANAQGQLGVGGFVDAPTPVPVPALSDVIVIVAGGNASLALRSDGTMWMWGRYGGLSHQRHHLLIESRDVPIQVGAAIDPVITAAGDLNTLAVLADGTLVSWGAQGFLGDGPSPTFNFYGGPEPVALTELMHARSLAVGGMHSLVMLDDGSVWSWGAAGPLGHRSSDHRPASVEGDFR